MPRYELVEGTSSKFWEITLDGKAFTTRWGRIGSDGQSATKRWPHIVAAQREHDKLVAEKVAKGYRLVKRASKAGTAPVNPAAAPPPARAVRNPDLERAILDAPDQADRWLVYADWLSQQGHPRGELIVVQHRLATDPKNKALKKAEADLLSTHAPVLLGPLAPYAKALDGTNRASFTWELGFIRSARFAWDHYADEARGDVDLAKAVDLLLSHPSGFCLRELVFGLNRADPDQEYQPLLDALAKRGAPALERLFVGDYEYPDQTEISWTHLGNFDKVYKSLPRLKKLELQGGGIGLGKIDLPSLQELEIRSGGLPEESVKALAKATWPSLERLVVWFGRDEYGGGGDISDLGPLLDARAVPKLRHLGLMNSEWADDLCRVLPKAKVVRQLSVLDLSMGTMTDDGAQALIDGAAAFRHLDLLDVSGNYLTKAKKRALEGIAKKVQFGTQREPDEYEGTIYRYTSVGE